MSQKEVRDYWADLVREHLGEGIDGIWNDMNDPSCGSSEQDDMLFEKGRRSHSTYHNQYAHLMAEATWEGFQRKDPNQRPFILSRSGFAGSQKYAALWTGDNVSRPSHLKMSIPMSLNLALSGVSLNGPDVGGFGFDTEEKLMVEWMKAGALFPFLRNHSSIGTRAQEPYAFSRKSLSIIRKCIYTRAKLLPYLYLQVYLHWRDGDAVMRPLSYEFRGAMYERVDDQYLIGPCLMVAPFVELEKPGREVVLPPGWWFSMQLGRWVKGGRKIKITREDVMSLFIRDGSILPCIEGDRFFPQPDFSKTEFHVFAKTVGAETEYYEDDGLSRNYQKDEYNLYRVKAPIRGRNLTPVIEVEHRGMPPGMEKATFYFYGKKPRDGKPVRARWPFGRFEAVRSEVELPKE